MEAGGAKVSGNINSAFPSEFLKSAIEPKSNQEVTLSAASLEPNTEFLHKPPNKNYLATEEFFSRLGKHKERAIFLVKILENFEGSSLVEKIAQLAKLCKTQQEEYSTDNLYKHKTEHQTILNKIQKHFGEDFISIMAQIPRTDLTLKKMGIKDSQGMQINSYSKFFNETYFTMTQKFFENLSKVESRTKFIKLILDQIKEPSTATKVAYLSKLCLENLKNDEKANQHTLINTLTNNFGHDFIKYLALSSLDDSSLKQYKLTDLDGNLINSHGNFFSRTSYFAAQKFFQTLEDNQLKNIFTNEILKDIPESSCSRKVANLSNICSEYIKEPEQYSNEPNINKIKKHFSDDFIFVLAQIPNSDQGLKKLNLKSSLSQEISSYAKFLYERPSYLIDKNETEKFFQTINNPELKKTFIQKILSPLRGAADVKISIVSNLCSQYLNKPQDYKEDELIKTIKSNFGEPFIKTLAQIPNSNQGLKSLNIKDSEGHIINSYSEILSERKLPQYKNDTIDQKHNDSHHLEKQFNNLIEHISEKQRLIEIPQQDLFCLFSNIQQSSTEYSTGISEEEFNKLIKNIESSTNQSLKETYTKEIDSKSLRDGNLHTEKEEFKNKTSINRIFSTAEALSISENQFPTSSWASLKKLFKAAAIHKLWNTYEERNHDEKISFLNELNTKSRDSESAFIKEIIREFINEEKNVNQLIKDSYTANKRSDYLARYNLDLGQIAKFNLTQALTILRTTKQSDSLLFAAPGSGKTLAAIAAAKFNHAKTLILCPAAIKEQWQENIKIFSPNQEESFRVISFSKMNNSNINNINRLAEENYNFIVIDESHYLKGKQSQIHHLTKHLIEKIRENNPSLKTLSMTATPMLIDLNDIRNSWEAVTGERIPHTSNLYRDTSQLREALVPHSIPFSKIDSKIPVSYQTGFHGEHYSEDLSVTLNLNSEKGKLLAQNLLNAKHPAHLEAELIWIKADNIASHCPKHEKTIIFTNYLNDSDGLNFNVIDELKEALLKQGFSDKQIAIFTGKNKEGLEKFKNDENSKILIMSPVSMYGIDGLQKVCSRMIIASSPWTTVIDQMIGRLARMGQKQKVEVLIPSIKIQTDNGEVLPEYELLKNEIIQRRLAIAKSFIAGDLLSQINLNEQSLMKLIQEHILQTKLDKNEGQINSRSLDPDLGESPIQSSHQKALNFSKLSKLIKQNDSHQIHQFLNTAEGKSLWNNYHNEIGSLYEGKVKPMDKLVWELISKPSIIKSNKEQDSVTIVNMGCGQDLMQTRMLRPITEKSSDTLYSHLKERLKLKEIKVFDIDHVSHKEKIGGIELKSIPDNASSLSATTLKEIKNTNGADLVIFSQSLIGKDWEYALVQASEILKPRGKILIIDEQNPWKMKHSNLSLDKLRSISAELNLDLEKREEGRYIFLKLQALNLSRS